MTHDVPSKTPAEVAPDLPPLGGTTLHFPDGQTQNLEVTGYTEMKGRPFAQITIPTAGGRVSSHIDAEALGNLIDPTSSESSVPETTPQHHSG